METLFPGRAPPPVAVTLLSDRPPALDGDHDRASKTDSADTGHVLLL